MVHFTQSRSALPIFFSSRRRSYNRRVTPFGNPRIIAYVLLPAAFRSLSRPSSPLSSQASTINLSLRLTILSFPLHFTLPASSSLRRLAPCTSLIRSLRSLRTYVFTHMPLGLKRVELLTPSLSEKCSNRLSYSPSANTHKKGKERVSISHLSSAPYTGA